MRFRHVAVTPQSPPPGLPPVTRRFQGNESGCRSHENQWIGLKFKEKKFRKTLFLMEKTMVPGCFWLGFSFQSSEEMGSWSSWIRSIANMFHMAIWPEHDKIPVWFASVSEKMTEPWGTLLESNVPLSKDGKNGLWSSHNRNPNTMVV